MKSFLIVDDDPSLLTMYEFLLDRLYTDTAISKAENGEEALEKIKKSDYSVILTDIQMPVMNGVEFYKNLKKEYPHLAHKVGFISGNPSQSDLAYFGEEGRPFLLKPFRYDDLYNMVHAIMTSEERKLNRERGNGCYRKHDRKEVVEECFLEPVRTGIKNRKSVTGEMTDLSEGGFGFQYSGDILPENFNANVSVKPLEILDKKAAMVWAYSTDDGVRSGFKWA